LHEGRIAWALAQLLMPGLLPDAAAGPDYLAAVGVENATHAKTAAAGHRIKFGDYIGTADTVALEVSHALSLVDIHTGRVGFDPFIFNPIGVNTRELGQRSERAAIRVCARGVIMIDGKTFNSDDAAAAALKEHWCAKISVDSDADLTTVAAVAATGIVLTQGADAANPSGTSVNAFTTLIPELAALIGQPLPENTGADATLSRLIRSAQQRRLALMHHAVPWRPSGEWPLVSVLLASNRPSMVSEALDRVLAQTYPNFEVHVALHGVGDDGFAATLRARDARVHVHSFDSGLNLGAIYGELTHRAQGRFIAKMDDDDLYSAHHLWDLMLAARYSGSALVGKVPTLTWLADEGELLLRSFGPEERYGQYVAGAAMLIEVDALREVGGWRPTPWAEDKALIDRFTDAGLLTYRAGQLGWAAVRHSGGHTWQRDHQHFRDLAETTWTGDAAQTLLTAALA
jgi:hypothetical protein